MSSPRQIGMTMYIIASILILVLLTVLFGDAIEHQRNPNSSPTSVTSDDGTKSITLQRNRAGHYVFNGQINGQPAEFLLDTGATAVSIPQPFADYLGLHKGAAMQAVTANGITVAYLTHIDSLVVGQIEERDVVASIVPNLPGSQILLGMSFLKRLDFYQTDDTLTLTQRTGQRTRRQP